MVKHNVISQICLSLLFLTAVPGFVAAQSIKLNGALVDGGNVNGVKFSHNGQWVLYAADQDTDGTEELFSVNLLGDLLPVKLNGTMVSGGRILSSIISSDDERVVYRAYQDLGGVAEIYSCPIDGSSPAVKLHPSLPVGRSVFNMKLSNDNSWVIFTVDPFVPDKRELFSVSADGSTPVTRLSGSTMADDGDVWNMEATPDSNTVVYRADLITNNQYDIFAVPITGGLSTRLNDDLPPGGSVSNFSIHPDGDRVLYKADQETLGIQELFIVSIGGGIPIKLSGEMTAGGNLGIYEITPDGSRVIYTADQDVDGIIELYSVSVLGGTVSKLSGNLGASGSIQNIPSISPDSQMVTFQHGPDFINDLNLYAAPVDGSSGLRRLNNTLRPGGSVQWNQPGSKIDANNNWVLYLADQDSETVELYAAPLHGGNAHKVNGEIGMGGEVSFGSAFTPNGRCIIYQADEEVTGRFELFSVNSHGGSRNKINDPVMGDGVSYFYSSPDNKKLAYTAYQDEIDKRELYLTHHCQKSYFIIPSSDGGASVLSL